MPPLLAGLEDRSLVAISALHPFRCRYTQEIQTVRNDAARGIRQPQPGQLQCRVVHEDTLSVVPSVEVGGTVAQPERKLVWREILCRQGQHVRELCQTTHQSE